MGIIRKKKSEFGDGTYFKGGLKKIKVSLKSIPEIAEHASKITGTEYSTGDGYKGKAFRHLQRNPVHRKHK